LASFYDNPEQNLPLASGTPLDKLVEKWDSEVSKDISELTLFT